MTLYCSPMCLLTMMEQTFHTGAPGRAICITMTSFKMTSLNLKKNKDPISNQHKFCLIVYKNNVIRIKIVEIMALFRVFLDHPSYMKFGSLQARGHIVSTSANG